MDRIVVGGTSRMKKNRAFLRSPGEPGEDLANDRGNWFDDLPAAEAAARRALSALGIPCWGSEEGPGNPGRFGVVFRGGRRALVMPVGTGEVSLDLMAAARCDYLILAEPGDRHWRITGYLYWFEAKGRGLTDLRRCSELRPRPLDTLPEAPLRALHFRLARLIGSLRLLIAGDPAVPRPIDPGSISGEI
jgi:hypothetical protein